MNEIQFWKKVAIIPFHECWEWTGATNGRYGIYGCSKRPRGYAHRYSWELHNKISIPKGMFILHSCDNPKCVNPSHLRMGTPKENVEDMYKRGRAKPRPGMLAPDKIRKLSDIDIIEIRGSVLSTRKIGKIYGICPSHVSSIKNKKKWKHLK